MILAEECGLKAGALHGTFADCYIIENHIKEAESQMKRSPRPLPVVTTGLKKGIFNWSHTDATLYNYNPYPRLNFSPILA
tara:strand:- start:578 stop:817 length:240 start_codon:yes stop_codon:yes gene_type:complete